jgi:hypothetical protein
MYDRFFHCGDIESAKQRATAESRTEYAWVLHEGVDYKDFDLRYVPSKYERTQAHVWGSHNNANSHTTWLIPQQMDAVNYHQEILPVSSTNRTVLLDRVDEQHLFSLDLGEDWTWVLDRRIDYSNFSLDWIPDSWEADKIHAFAMADQPDIAYIFLINRRAADSKEFVYHAAELVFVTPIRKITWPDLADTMMTGNDWYASLCDWISAQDIDDEWIWIVDDRIDYADFDFGFLPPRWDQHYIHCFTNSGKEQLSYTWLVNMKHVGDKVYKFIPSDLRFRELPERLIIDMGNVSTADNKVRFVGNMEAVLKSALKRARSEWLHITSSCCDYADFDFRWLPDLDQIAHVHCWPSDSQEKGETFLIHVPSYRALGEFRFNFDHSSVKRLPWPVVEYDDDSLSKAIKSNPSDSLYTLYIKRGEQHPQQPVPCLWEKRPVISMNDSQSIALVPRDCLVNLEIYEYPYLMKQQQIADELMDVIFISYDEPQADANWQILVDKCPRAQRLHGVKGMERALEEAARSSKTDYFYAVFAKTKLHEDFDFSIVPDYFQKPKHYIFDCVNSMNGLRYGHMGVIMYSKNIILDAIDKPFGLDYTMSWEHAVIPVTSCYGEFNSGPFQTWRTAFRECCKIPYYSSLNPSIEGEYRLHVWQTHAEGEHAEWCLNGARDGVAFYEANQGDFAALKQTFSWEWLRQYFVSLYGDVE